MPSAFSPSVRHLRRAAGGLLAVGLFCAGAAQAAATLPVGDPVRGQKLFLQCRACHTPTPDGANTVGPNLFGVFGAKAATKPGFNYSTGLAHSGLTWSAETLDAWLTRPSTLVPGTKMAFPGIALAQNRSDVIAYLKTLRRK